MKKLSSGFAVVYQRVYPVFFAVLTVYGFLAFSLGWMKGEHGQPVAGYVKWIVLSAGGLATGWALCQAMLIQDVEMGNGMIKISGLRGIEEIGFDRIESIRETRLRNPKLVIIRLRTKSGFGKIIRFIPCGNGRFFREHPVVSELIAAVKKATPPPLHTTPGRGQAC